MWNYLDTRVPRRIFRYNKNETQHERHHQHIQMEMERRQNGLYRRYCLLRRIRFIYLVRIVRN